MPSLRLVASPPPPTALPLPAVVAPLRTLFPDTDWLVDLEPAGFRALVRETAFAVAALMSEGQARRVVPTEAAVRRRGAGLSKGAVWELGLTRDGGDILVSVFTAGRRPCLAQSGHRVSIAAFVEALLASINVCDAQFLQSSPAPESGIVEMDGVRPSERGLALAHDKLVSVRDMIQGQRFAMTRWVNVPVTSDETSSLSLSGQMRIACVDRPPAAQVRRADVHALLYRGDLRIARGQFVRELRDVHLYLLVEQFAHLVSEALCMQGDGRGFVEQTSVGGLRCGIDVDGRGDASLSFIDGARAGAREWRLAPMPIDELAHAVVTLGFDVVRAIVDNDGAQRQNLRLDRFVDSLGQLKDRLGAAQQPEAVLNGDPESYRAFAESDMPSRGSDDLPSALVGDPPPVRPASAGSKLRFTESWRAVVPGIDLRSLFLCGDRLIVGCSRELACLARTNGQLLWRRRARRAVTIMTPVGVARLGADGLLSIHDIDDGDVTIELQLGPSVGGSARGAVVNSPGLPHMLLVTEGVDQLVAIDLDSGELRWRRPLPSGSSNGKPSMTRLRRAGKLVLTTDGSNELVALDLLSGETVWRQRSSECFRSGVNLSGGDVFAISCNRQRMEGTVHRFDPWTGAELWRSALPADYRVSGTPRTSKDTVVSLVDERSSQGEVLRSGLIAFDRETGELRYDMSGGLCVGAAASLMVDDLLVASGERGELVGIEVADGTTRFRHVFAPQAADVPSSLQPVLRSGALFVPQSEVFVVRPRDGAVIGRVPTDLIPDRIRVDERCGVYVAEMSGYLAAYHALPMLTLVSPT